MLRSDRWWGFAALSSLTIGMLALAIPARPGRAQAPEQVRAPAWEYRFVNAPLYLNDQELMFDDLGRRGWEYCETRGGTRKDDQGHIRNVTVIIFKRQARPAPPDPK